MKFMNKFHNKVHAIMLPFSYFSVAQLEGSATVCYKYEYDGHVHELICKIQLGLGM